MFIKDKFSDLPEDVYNLIGGPLYATVVVKKPEKLEKIGEDNNMAMTKLDETKLADNENFTDRYNSLNYFMNCIDAYIRHHNLDPTDWKIVGFGTGTAYDSWHHQITIEAPDGMEKTIRIPMYKRANNNFTEHFINEV